MFELALDISFFFSKRSLVVKGLGQLAIRKDRTHRLRSSIVSAQFQLPQTCAIPKSGCHRSCRSLILQEAEKDRGSWVQCSWDLDIGNVWKLEMEAPKLASVDEFPDWTGEIFAICIFSQYFCLPFSWLSYSICLLGTTVIRSYARLLGIWVRPQASARWR